MQLTDQQTLPVSQDIAWAALNDLDLLREAIAGCESIAPVPGTENEYDVALMATIGPVKARFTGKMRMAEMNPPTSYQLQFEAKAAAGHGKGTARVSLTALGANETRLDYEVQASVGGKLAQIGSRLVDMAAQKMAADFFEKLRTLLAARHGVPEAAPSVAEAAPAGAGVFARLVAWIRRLFGA